MLVELPRECKPQRAADFAKGGGRGTHWLATDAAIIDAAVETQGARYLGSRS
jgi:hypothetical protein